jgi:D-alanine--D-alanine ligase
MNKEFAKKVLAAAGLRVPKGRLATTVEEAEGFPMPAVVKPNAQGSTVGLTFVSEPDKLKPAMEKALAYDCEALVEEWLKGIEISVPVLGDRPLLPVEILPASGQYDFASKYVPGGTQEIVPARLPEKLLKQSEDIALLAHRALGCEGATRTDMIVVGDEIVVLETNTLPGMTPTSLLPNSARAAGIPFDELVEWMLFDALERHAAKT